MKKVNKQSIVREIKVERGKTILDFSRAMQDADLGYIHSRSFDRYPFTSHMQQAWDRYVALSIELYDLTHVRV